MKKIKYARFIKNNSIPSKNFQSGKHPFQVSIMGLGPKSEFNRKWTDEDLERALDAVRNGMSYGKASQLFGIPKTTLYDRSKGKVEKERRNGPKSYLGEEIEDALAKWLKKMALLGYG